MKKNKLYSVLLGVLLMVSGQVLCSEPLTETVHEHLSASPEWLTNLVPNLSAKQFLLYGGLVALMGYILYRFSNGASSTVTNVPKNIDTPKKINDSEIKKNPVCIPVCINGKKLNDPELKKLDHENNLFNIATIIRGYDADSNDAVIREMAFQEYVVPVLKEHEKNLKDDWRKFLQNISTNIVNQSDKRIQWAVKKTYCPYKVALKMEALTTANGKNVVFGEPHPLYQLLYGQRSQTDNLDR